MPTQRTTVPDPLWRVPETAAPLGPRFDGVPPYGGLSSITKDNLYWFGGRGFVFTSPWVMTPSTLRQVPVILLTVSGEPFELTLGNCVVRQSAVGIAPMTKRGLRAIDVGLVSINVGVRHPRFDAFRAIASRGLLSLDRKRFARFDNELARAYQGQLTFSQADWLFESLVETAAGQLPRSNRRDCRADRIHEFIRDHPTCSLDDLARALRLSYTGASHLFSRAIGVPFRNYQQWLKCVTAAEQFDLHDRLVSVAHVAGFTDSAHLSRTWQHSYGLSPSYVRDAKYVRIIAPQGRTRRHRRPTSAESAP